MKKIKHIGIIMDGNRRFARALNLSPWKGHEYGEKKVRELLTWCKELEIKEVSLYAFSVQNKNRPKKEFDYLMKLFKKGMKNLLEDEEFKKSGVRVKILGDLTIFPKDVQEEMNLLVKKTKKNKKHFLNLALGYGGREELIHAVKKIAFEVKKGKLKPEQINEETITKNLFLSSEPDLIIRTGGECRTSNFLPWQSTYSEWMFIKKKWPEFTKKDLEACLETFSKRERRFGQ